MRRTYAQQQKEAPSLTGFIAADRHAFYTDCVLTSELVLYKSTAVLRKSLLLAYNLCRYCHRCCCHLHRRVQCIGYANMRKSTLELAFCFDTDCTFSFIAGLVSSSFLFWGKNQGLVELKGQVMTAIYSDWICLEIDLTLDRK